MKTSSTILVSTLVLLSGAAAVWFFGTGRSAARGASSDPAAASGPATAAAEEGDGGPGGDAPSGGDPDEAASDEPAVRAPTKLPVEGVVVTRAPFVVSVRATGRAEAHRRAELAVPVSGRIDAVHVKVGDRVRAGQALVELDARAYEIARNEADARASIAEGDLRVRLLSDSTVSADRRRRAEHQSGLTQAREARARAELDLEGTRLAAPFAGEVAEVRAVTGALARREEALITLVDLDPIRVRAEILESDYGQIQPGASVRVRFPAYPGQTFEGELEALGPEIDAARGTGTAFVALANADGKLKPGMYAELEIAGSVHADRLSVPRDALLERDRRLLVFRASAGRAEWEYVETGLETRGRVEIVSGLAPGDTVLVDGHLTIAHGAPVQVTLRRD
ncbi:MAG: secretion protein HlyD [Gemmatimonadota bacterium]|nr:MAG: secretion protein HlyD [Gemmatimonadota bacterium]